MYPVIIDQDTMHFEVCLLAVLLVLELDERILQTISSTLVADDFA